MASAARQCSFASSCQLAFQILSTHSLFLESGCIVDTALTCITELDNSHLLLMTIADVSFLLDVEVPYRHYLVRIWKIYVHGIINVTITISLSIDLSY
ncbi:hypothetical protein PUN28_001497 [Cardiocondyla obscurior]|uniref:Uncharacterized protein n=1 Tax=Cardiocondyla obscurior TaxID=286306 RepID=A0AAW2H5T0_9HYME